MASIDYLDQDESSKEPDGGEYARGRRQAAPMPGEPWAQLISLLERSAPSARRDLFLGWLENCRDRSADRSQRKFQQTGEYRQRRKLLREAEKGETRRKESAIKKEKYHADRAADGITTRRNKDLSGMTAEEVAQHKKDQARDRQRRKRGREKLGARTASEASKVPAIHRIRTVANSTGVALARTVRQQRSH